MFRVIGINAVAFHFCFCWAGGGAGGGLSFSVWRAPLANIVADPSDTLLLFSRNAPPTSPPPPLTMSSDADPIRLHGQAAQFAAQPYREDIGQLGLTLRELLNTSKTTQENLDDIKPGQVFALFISVLTNRLEHTLAGGAVLNNVKQAMAHISESALTTFESTVQGIDMLDALADWREPRESVPLPAPLSSKPVKKRPRPTEAPPTSSSSSSVAAAEQRQQTAPRPPSVQSSGMASLLGRLGVKKN